MLVKFTADSFLREVLRRLCGGSAEALRRLCGSFVFYRDWFSCTLYPCGGQHPRTDLFLRRLCGGSAKALRRLCGCFVSDAECLFRDALPLDDRPGKLFTRYILLTNTVKKVRIFFIFAGLAKYRAAESLDY